MEPDSYLHPRQTGETLHPPLIDTQGSEQIWAARERLADVVTSLWESGGPLPEQVATSLRDPESPLFVICSPIAYQRIMFDETQAQCLTKPRHKVSP